MKRTLDFPPAAGFKGKKGQETVLSYFKKYIHQNQIEKHWCTMSSCNVVAFSTMLTNKYFARNIKIILRFSKTKIVLLNNLIKPWLEPILNFFHNIFQLKLHKLSSDYTFRALHKFDESHNLLWERYKRLYDVIAVRDKTALNWYYFSSDDLQLNRRVLEVKCRKRLIAYASLNIVEVIKANGEIYHYYSIVDMMVIVQVKQEIYREMKAEQNKMGNGKLGKQWKKIISMIMMIMIKSLNIF